MHVCVVWKGSSRYETDFFVFVFFLGPGGVVVNSNRRNPLFAHKSSRVYFSLLVCVIYQAFLRNIYFYKPNTKVDILQSDLTKRQ